MNGNGRSAGTLPTIWVSTLLIATILAGQCPVESQSHEATPTIKERPAIRPVKRKEDIQVDLDLDSPQIKPGGKRE